MSGTQQPTEHPDPELREEVQTSAPAEEREVAERTPDGEAAPSQPTEPQQPSPQPDWRDKRIATLTRRLRELQEKQGQPGPVQQVPQPTPQPTQQQLDQATIDARARELSIIQDFNRRCDEAALAGRAAFGESEFNGRIQNLQKLSDSTDPASVNAYNSLLMAALEAGEAPRLLFELGADLNEAQRILAMSPTKMAVELTKRAAKPPVEVSNAPRPITPLGGRPASHERIEPDDPDKADHLSTQEWMRRREQQLSARRQATG